MPTSSEIMEEERLRTEAVVAAPEPQTRNVISFVRPEAQVETWRPYIAGKSFDELWGIPGDVRDALIARGLVFCTEFERGGNTYGGDIIAASWEQAEQIAAARGLNETVVGQVGAIIPA